MGYASGEQDPSTLNPVEMASPMPGDKHHLQFEPIQQIHVVKKSATGEFESIE